MDDYDYYRLAGGAITILKNMKVNGKDYLIYYGKYNSCLKPPTSRCYITPYWIMIYPLAI